MTPIIGEDGTIHLGRRANRQTLHVGVDYEDEGQIIDLTGASARMDFRTDAESAPSLTLTNESGEGISFVALSGELDAIASPEQLKDLCGYYVWAIAIRLPSGEVPSVICGDVEFFRPPVEVPGE
jgi:hypothetical protein